MGSEGNGLEKAKSRLKTRVHKKGKKVGHCENVVHLVVAISHGMVLLGVNSIKT